MHEHGLNCRDALAKLYDYIDGELDAADRDALQAHLEACRPCLSRYEFEQFFTEFVKRNTSQPRVREEFKTRLLACLAEERRAPHAMQDTEPVVATPAHRGIFRLMPRFAVAALVVLLVGAGSWWMAHKATPAVNWALLTGYHLGTMEVQEDGLDTDNFNDARAFLVSRLGPGSDTILPRAIPSELTAHSACLLPCGDQKLAQFEFMVDGNKVSLFIVPVASFPKMDDPEQYPRMVVGDHDYHMVTTGGVNSLCWKDHAGYMCAIMGPADFPTMLAWAEKIRRPKSA